MAKDKQLGMHRQNAQKTKWSKNKQEQPPEKRKQAPKRSQPGYHFKILETNQYDA